VETLTYGSGRASGCDSPGLLNSDSCLLDVHSDDLLVTRVGAAIGAGFEFLHWWANRRTG